MTAPPIITLLTDFGHKDPYVGVMKGVILGVCRAARIVDLTHEVAAQQVAEANFALRGAFRHFPAGTVHVVVVDPGVGSERRILCARAHDMFFLAPDNGVLTGVLRAGDPVRAVTARRLFRDGPLSRTFHGRDIFAPVAAHLACGEPFAAVGPAAPAPMRLDLPVPARAADGGLVGAVVHVDRFGNLISNLCEEDLDALAPERRVVTFRGQRIGAPAASYAAAPSGSPLAIIDSFGFLEIAVNQGSAAKHFNAGPGDPLRVG